MRRFMILLTAVSVTAALPTTAFADGKQLYEALCQTCHGAEGLGDGPGIGPDTLRPRPFKANVFKFDTDMDWQKGTDSDLKAVIRDGAQVYGGSPLMPPWPALSDTELDELVAHVRSLQ